MPESVNRQLQPEKQIIDPKVYNTVVLDDISIKSSKLLSQSELNQKYLNAILAELRNEADEGQELSENGTVLSTEFTFIDIGQLRQGLKIKSFELVNDSTTNSLYFAWNTTKAGLQPSLDDPHSSLTRFRLLQPGDSTKRVFNRKVIRNIALLGNGASVPFRLWMVW